MPLPTIEWIGDLNGEARLIDQTLLPGRLEYLNCRDVDCLWQAIRNLKVRGAPAIGIAAGFGVVLGIRNSTACNFKEFLEDLQKVIDHLSKARPTAVNLFWSLERMKNAATAHRDLPPQRIKENLLAEARKIVEEDKKVCRRIGENGAALVEDKTSVLTHCNAGGLATADYGTALAVIFRAHELGKKVHVFVDETRPLLQGARLTAWELVQAGIEATLICDNMAGAVMKQGKIQAVIVGADRIAANGDTANKIGTYTLAVLAREHSVPFYVAAPLSTFDLSVANGDMIPIEERAGSEITEWGGRKIAPDGIATYCPAFDVTPASYITAIVTERGIIRRPNASRVRDHLKSDSGR